MGTAARIRVHRIRAGKSASGIAKRLGINEAWYDDLERRDDELESTLTLFQAMELASLIGVRLFDLLVETPPSEERIDLMDLPERIRAYLARTGLTLGQFEDNVGWALGPFMQSPIHAAAESPIMFLKALAEPLGINWLALVPDEPVL